MTGEVRILPVLPEGEVGPALLASLHDMAFSAQDEMPWSEDDFRQMVVSPGVSALVACLGQQPVGFALWRQVLDEAELITIGIDPALRGRGYARYVMDFIVARLREEEGAKLFLEVRVDNAPAVGLYRSLGFQEIGKRRRYYQTQSGKRVDAVCFMLILNNANASK